MASSAPSPANDPVMITGAAGFIGFSLAKRLLESGRPVIGVDNVNSYYDPALKDARLAVLRRSNNFTFHRIDLANREATEAIFRDSDFGPVVHFAAQASVRYSLQNPYAYLDANLTGFLNVLEGCRHRGTAHLLFASSSSVYGANTRLPLSVHHNVDHPISLYAATKKANELMAHAYSHLYGLPTTGLRFFTVYGPWGRPDMAMYLFAQAIAEGRPIKLFNHGHTRRDFTYIDDVVEAVVRLVDMPASGSPKWSGDAPDPATSAGPYRIYNIGNNRSVDLERVVYLLEKEYGRKAIRELLPMQPGDVLETRADIDDLVRDTGFSPSTPIEEGVHRFVDWFRSYAANRKGAAHS